MTGRRPWLMVVSDRRRLCAASGRTPAAADALLERQVLAAAAAGVAAFQLREPDLDGAALLTLAQRLRGAAGPALHLLVNERADVAAAAGAGVHLRSRSVPAPRLRAWLTQPIWMSRAVHGVGELADAAAVDLVVAGTVRATASKPGQAAVLGLDGLAAIAAASPVPVIGIGGLDADDWPTLRAAGAVGFAAIGAFLPRSGETVADAVGRVVAAVGGVVDSTGRRF
ncbi:MAG: thiamine phosphate synthase [Vicinamibacterales bacterium]